jgi:KRAB domain-containing zinc finger protein
MDKINYFLLLLSLLHQNLYSSQSPLFQLVTMIEQLQNGPTQAPEEQLGAPLQPLTTDAPDFSESVPAWLALQKSKKDIKKVHACEKCGSTFARREGLRRHMVIHSGERAFECGVCHKSFSRSDNLRAHIKIHANKKPITIRKEQIALACSFPDCNKTFKGVRGLRVHRCVHNTSTNNREVPMTQEADESLLDYTLLFNELVHSPTPSSFAEEIGKPLEDTQLPEQQLPNSAFLKRQCTFPGCSLIFRNPQGLLQHRKVHFKLNPLS